MSNGDEGIKAMEIGQRHAGKTFTDALGYWQDSVTIDENGWADFPCHGRSLSIWTSGYSQ
jgi:alpha-amylase